MLDHLNERMREFTDQQEMFFLATSDGNGECDSSFRAGPPGFLRVLDEHTLVYPEYRGNGVHASLGNIQENPHLGILMIDFIRARIGLHVNGRARIVEDAELRAAHPDLPQDPVPGRRAELWVEVTVEEAYLHCAKHIPHLQKVTRHNARDWGTDDYKRKGGDFFGAARAARQRGQADWRDQPRPQEPPAAPDPHHDPAAPARPGRHAAPAPEAQPAPGARPVPSVSPPIPVANGHAAPTGPAHGHPVEGHPAADGHGVPVGGAPTAGPPAGETRQTSVQRPARAAGAPSASAQQPTAQRREARRTDERPSVDRAAYTVSVPDGHLVPLPDAHAPVPFVPAPVPDVSGAPAGGAHPVPGTVPDGPGGGPAPDAAYELPPGTGESGSRTAGWEPALAESAGPHHSVPPARRGGSAPDVEPTTLELSTVSPATREPQRDGATRGARSARTATASGVSSTMRIATLPNAPGTADGSGTDGQRGQVRQPGRRGDPETGHPGTDVLNGRVVRTGSTPPDSPFGELGGPDCVFGTQPPHVEGHPGEPAAPGHASAHPRGSGGRTASGAVNGASGAIAARGALLSGVPTPPHGVPPYDPSAGPPEDSADVTAWREQAERALAEAHRREGEGGEPPFQGWFG
ncbi:hypothetical protein E0L36_18875 [Streptomyces sp. AJS327]|nr:hypothetical protein [Streptomyces sp. AJS327]